MEKIKERENPKRMLRRRRESWWCRGEVRSCELERGGGAEGWRSSLPLRTPELLRRGAVRPRRLTVAGFRPVVREHGAG